MKPVVTLTEKAIEHIESILEQNQDAEGVRVSIVSSGCSGHSYKFDLVKNLDDVSSDAVVEQGGVKVYIEQKSLLYLIGAEMDFKDDKFKSGFSFSNPNEENACGCGESVNFKRSDLPKM